MQTVKQKIGWLPTGARFKISGEQVFEITSTGFPVKYKRVKEDGTLDDESELTLDRKRDEYVVQLIHPKYKFPADTSEYLIQEVLCDLIEKCKQKFYTEKFKGSLEFNSRQTELDVLGGIISKYCEWEPGEIEDVCKAAFEDSNYTVVDIVTK